MQHRYLANCSSATCSLAYSSSVTAGNTLVYGLGWPSNQQYNYVPITVTNCQLQTFALSLDGSNTGSFSSTNSGSVSLTTGSSNDVIVVVVANENRPGSHMRTVSSMSSAGLTFAEPFSGTSERTRTSMWRCGGRSPPRS